MLLESYPFLSLVPPLLAIILAVYTRQVYFSLFAGIAVGTTVLADGHLIKGIADAIEACVLVFKDAGNTRVIIFSVLVGALIALLQRSGGIEGFTSLVTRKGIVRGKRSVELTAFIIGVVIFIESSITCLVTGTIARPLTDKYKISREKLAYICDSTSAPICAAFRAATGLSLFEAETGWRKRARMRYRWIPILTSTTTLRIPW